MLSMDTTTSVETSDIVDGNTTTHRTVKRSTMRTTRQSLNLSAVPIVEASEVDTSASVDSPSGAS